MARLKWRQKNGPGKAFSLGAKALLGRDAALDCVLDVKSVSRRHARIERHDSGFFIVDLGSTNGTLVNGVRISGETRLSPGDLVQVGEEVLEFEPDFPATQLTRGSLATETLERGEEASKSASAGAGAEALPRRAGKFYLLRRLGQGGMGVVYRAIDLDSNREVAVKFIRSNIGRNEAFLDFFHNREAVLAREIDHPNVIRVYEHGVDAEQHYISMEFIPGENLYQVMKRRRLKRDEVLEIMRQVACGLAAAHRQGVVHSDIKPANILLMGAGGREAPSSKEDAPRAEAEGDSSNGILEFESEPPRGNGSLEEGSRYEPGLLEEIRRRVGEPSRDAVVDPPFFPRPSEMRFLLHYFERIYEGKGYFLLVEGEAGTGKDRLISEFLRELSGSTGERLVCFHELDCSRIEGMPLLYEQIFQTRPPGTRSLPQIVDELSSYLAEETTPRLIRILNLGSITPLACDLMLSLVRLMPKQGLVLLASLDPDDIRQNGSLKDLLERIALHSKEVYLRPLTEYQIHRYLQYVFRDALTGLDLGPDLYRLSRGNFAKLLEILRSFFERGILTMDQPSGRLLYRPRAQEFELEEGKHLYEKYRSYGKVEQRVLEHAAFIGTRFLFDTLLKLYDVNETSLFFIVRTLLAEGFFVEESRTWYSFTNTAFQRYMADRIPSADRPHLHRKVSRLLQNAPVPESAELFRLRAQHFAGCHEYPKAVLCLLEGAHLARNAYRVDLARDMFQEIIGIYRLLARRESVRKEVTGILRDWFRRDGNWYEILGELGSDAPEAKIKITDFGISFRLKDEERGYQVEKRPALGTPRYMAPERSKGEYGGFKSDIFALGIITYEMTSGEPPFPELKGNDVIQANREQRISLLPEVLEQYPVGMQALVSGMLEKDPLRRWDSERVLREVVKLQFDAKKG